jgi:hypothetical protein
VAYWALDLTRRRIVGRNTVELCPGPVAGTHGRSIATGARDVAGLRLEAGGRYIVELNECGWRVR